MRRFIRCAVLLTAILVAGQLLGHGSSAVAAENRVALSIGMISDRPSVPLEHINGDAGLPFTLVPVVSLRSEAFPWLTPLPRTMTQTPEIVNAQVGYSCNDLVQLIDLGLIEPLDGLFQELGIDPKEYFLPSAYEAVCYDGHIWAIPHRAQVYLLSVDEPTFKRLGLSAEVTTWGDVLNASRKISLEAVADERIPGFTEGDVPVDLGAALLVDFIERAERAGKATERIRFFDQLVADKVLEGSPGFVGKAIRLETLATLDPRHQTRTSAAPSTAAIDDPGDAKFGSLGFLECFALRKNTEARFALAKAFAQWLLAPENQMDMVHASRLDVPVSRLEMCQRHVPVIRPVLESDDFKRLCQTTPAYQALADAVRGADFSTPDEARAAQEELEAYHGLLTYVIESTDLREVLERFAQAEALLASVSSDAEPSPAPATTTSLDEY
ncbi:MAG: hypothetical protein JXR94_16020 [Candidatus Hydrogenedentes bacterium]|nr:hypothetical protein [Candidatus Hydrogenedentota bacterium]